MIPVRLRGRLGVGDVDRRLPSDLEFLIDAPDSISARIWPNFLRSELPSFL